MQVDYDEAPAGCGLDSLAISINGRTNHIDSGANDVDTRANDFDSRAKTIDTRANHFDCRAKAIDAAEMAADRGANASYISANGCDRGADAEETKEILPEYRATAVCVKRNSASEAARRSDKTFETQRHGEPSTAIGRNQSRLHRST